MKACQDSKKTAEPTPTTTTTQGAEQESAKMDDGSIASYIKWLTTGFNSVFGGVIGYIVECIKSLMRVFITTAGIFFNLIGKEEVTFLYF